MRTTILSIIISIIATASVCYYKNRQVQEQLRATQAELQKANLIISQQAQDIIKANTAINTQNMALETMRVTLKKKDLEAKQSYQSLNELYQKELNSSTIALKEDSSCEKQLQLIQDAWEEFVFK